MLLPDYQMWNISWRKWEIKSFISMNLVSALANSDDGQFLVKLKPWQLMWKLHVCKSTVVDEIQGIQLLFSSIYRFKVIM